jgi:protocatechuate 3,4-dioxygenase beta subunit
MEDIVVDTNLTRRQLQRLALAMPAPLALAVLSGRTAGIALAQTETTATPEPAATPTLAPTPACDDGDLDETLEQTEGPFYTPSSPERVSLRESDLPGTNLTVTGYVYSTDCQPVAGALLDFWHCDDAGVYDNEGFRLRGHQFSDEHGLWRLETIVPGLYTGRTRHIHVKVQAPDQPVLTTQLYFPNEPENERDGIFNPALVVDLPDSAPDGDELVAFFTFVVER